MYHCNACYYFVNIPEEMKACIEKIPAMPKFTHRFVESTELDKELLSQADLIFLFMEKVNSELITETVEGKKPFAEVIVCTADEAVYGSDLSNIYDVWKFPMQEKEVSFRFQSLQKIYKQMTDYWLAHNYLNSAINSVPDLIWYKTKDGIHLKVNESFCKAVNKTMEDIEGKDHCYIWDIDPVEFAKGVDVCKESEEEVMSKRKTCVGEENVKIGDEIRKFVTYKSPLFDIDGTVMGTVGVGKDVTQERLYEQMILDNANRDFLTGLYNRRYLYQFMEEEKESPLAFYYIDLDNFKSVNDTYGHQAGDEALLLAKEVLEQQMPEALIARIGGDEFLVAEKGERTQEEIEESRMELRSFLNDAFRAREKLKRVSASVGTAYSAKGETADIDRLIERADGLMYEEKMSKKIMRR